MLERQPGHFPGHGQRLHAATAASARSPSGAPPPLDPDEGRKLAEMAGLMDLGYAVITSVTRDDLADKGSGHFAAVIRTLKRERPQLKIEVLVPDFDGQPDCLDLVLDAGPDVLAHNVETVPSLYPKVNRRAARFRPIRCASWSAARSGAGSPRPA